MLLLFQSLEIGRGSVLYRMRMASKIIPNISAISVKLKVYAIDSSLADRCGDMALLRFGRNAGGWSFTVLTRPDLTLAQISLVQIYYILQYLIQTPRIMVRRTILSVSGHKYSADLVHSGESCIAITPSHRNIR